jgi:hypothetical protein
MSETKKTILTVGAVLLLVGAVVAMAMPHVLQKAHQECARRFTVTAYSSTGSVIGRWEHCEIDTARSGWCRVIMPTGKFVLIDGPHTWEEE